MNLTPDDLVLYTEDGIIKSGGYSLNSILMKNKMSGGADDKLDDVDEMASKFLSCTVPADLMCVKNTIRNLDLNSSDDSEDELDDLEDIQQIDHVPLDDVIHDKLLLHMNHKNQKKQNSPTKLKKTKRDHKENKKNTRKQVRFA